MWNGDKWNTYKIPVFGSWYTVDEIRERFGLHSHTIRKRAAKVCWNSPEGIGREIEKGIGEMWKSLYGKRQETYTDGMGI